VRLASLAGGLVDFCYPRVCLACAQPLQEASGHPLSLCDDCATQLSSLESAPFCDRCGLPISEPHAPCARCQSGGVPHFYRVIRLGVFQEPLKHLIKQMKNHRRWPIAEMLAGRVTSHEPAKALLSQTDVLVPVPLHPFRQIARGYNQAEVLAQSIGRICRIPLARPMVRARRTPMQTTMTSPTQRIENLRDAFLLINPKHIQEKHVLLIDDVMTTGATLQSAARALAEAQPASLCALVIAVADPKHQDFQTI
jgi:ComF family protein